MTQADPLGGSVCHHQPPEGRPRRYSTPEND